jgi:hypothetical protein
VSEETGAAYRVAPTTDGRPSLPKRTGAKTMLPSTWMNRTIRVEYLDAHGSGAQVSGTFLDWCVLGLIMNVSGARTILSWDSVRLVELVEDA